MTFRLRDASEPGLAARWDALARASAQDTPFATLAFARALARVQPLRLHVATVDDGGPAGRLRAGALVYARRAGPLRLAVAPALSYYATPLLDGPLAAAAVAEHRSPLDRLIEGLQGAFDAVAFQLHPTLADVRPFVWAGFDARVLYTYRLAAGDAPGALRRNHARTLRRDAAHAVFDVPPDYPHALALVRARYARAGARALPVARHAALFADLSRSDGGAGHLRMLACADRPADTPHAALALLEGRAEHHGWMAGSADGASLTRLQHDALARARAAGVAYDFGGANTPSVAAFKAGFGVPLVPFYRVAWHRPGLARLVSRLRPLV